MPINEPPFDNTIKPKIGRILNFGQFADLWLCEYTDSALNSTPQSEKYAFYVNSSWAVESFDLAILKKLQRINNWTD